MRTIKENWKVILITITLVFTIYWGALLTIYGIEQYNIYKEEQAIKQEELDWFCSQLWRESFIDHNGICDDWGE